LLVSGNLEGLKGHGRLANSIFGGLEQTDGLFVCFSLLVSPSARERFLSISNG